MLREELEPKNLTGTIGIGHTRWATHGEPSDVNAHPHFNEANTIAVVHNGIIENYQSIREWLQGEGYRFRSETDTEVVAHLIDHYYRGDLNQAVEDAVHRIKGAYALVVMSSSHPDELIVVRKDSPLIIGVGENENYVASDIPAILKYTRNVYFLEDGEIARVRRNRIDIRDAFGKPVMRPLFHVDWEADEAEKGGYSHFMLKEINEQPKALRDTLRARMSDDNAVDLDDINLPITYVKDLKRIVIVACGTAYHAGLTGKYLFEQALGIPVEVDIASEFRYREPVIHEGDLFICISQSGETADTLAALRYAKEKGAHVLAVTNVIGSTASREADSVLYTLAGPEIAVASTKAYITQVLSMILLMLEFAYVRGDMPKNEYQAYLENIANIPELVAKLVENNREIVRAAQNFSNQPDMYFLGRNLDYPSAMEGSLKLKEISYIHSEAFAAGELKHGPIALIEEGTLVVAVSSQKRLEEKIASNIKQVKARGAYVLAVCREGSKEIIESADETFLIPETDEIFMPLLTTVPMQLFAYYCAVKRGFDVDKPRNLAKSVTVE